MTPNMILIIMTGVILIAVHGTMLMIHVVSWIISQRISSVSERHKQIKDIAQDIGIEYRSFPPQKGLTFLSWYVYVKRVREYYIPYANLIRKLEGDWEMKIKPDTVPRYFYGALTSHKDLKFLLATDDTANPFIMVTQKTVSRGKRRVDHLRYIYYKTDDFNLPDCTVVPVDEFMDNLAPTEGDINFKSDEDFSKKFDLIGENEGAIRNLINASVREIMANNPHWTWTFKNNQILIKYKLEHQTRRTLSDVKASLGELAKLHKELSHIDFSAIVSEEEMEAERPDEVISKALYRKRMATFGCAIGCGSFFFPFGLFILWGFLSTFDFELLGPFFLFSFIGFFSFIWGWSEWKRNKKLKADGKVID